MLVAAGYEHHAVARDPDAVDVDDAEDLVRRLRHRPYRSEEGGPPPEGSAAPRHIGLRPAREQSADEGRELPGRHVVGMRGAGAARPAAPSLGARRGPPVPLHGPSAGRAFHITHGILPESVTFYREFPHATWENVNNRTHFLSEWEVDSDDFSHKKWALACANAQNQTHYLSYKPQPPSLKTKKPRNSSASQ